LIKLFWSKWKGIVNWTHIFRMTFLIGLFLVFNKVVVFLVDVYVVIICVTIISLRKNLKEDCDHAQRSCWTVLEELINLQKHNEEGNLDFWPCICCLWIFLGKNAIFFWLSIDRGKMQGQSCFGICRHCYVCG